MEGFPRIKEKRQPDSLGLLLFVATTGLKPCFPHPNQLYPALPAGAQSKQPNLSIQVS